MSLETETHNAVEVLGRLGRELSEAKRTPDCSPLVMHLTSRLAQCESWFAEYEQAAPGLEAADATYAASVAAVITANERKNFGTTDATEARALIDACDVAMMARSVHGRALEAAKQAAATPLSRIAKWRTDARRDRAEDLVRGLAYRFREDYPMPNRMSPLEVHAEERLWLPYYKARTLKEYDGRTPEQLARALREFVAAYPAAQPAQPAQPQAAT